MRKEKKYLIVGEARIPFRNNADYCIGSGRMGLALHKEYWEQLKLIQEKIGFQHIRGHGLFCDDMAIYQEYIDADGNTAVEYNFTYLDMVMDSYRELGLRLFLELGFMPEKMASGDQTVFYWKGNVTPPKSYAAWTALVQSTLNHLMQRYGAQEVVQWPIEVWNEPNLNIFWKNADMNEYFRFFMCTFQAIKELDSRFRVGGPAICGTDCELWIRAFLQFCSDNHLNPDFITRHHYTIQKPDYVGHYAYAVPDDPDNGLKELKITRNIVDSFPEFKDKEIHITEFNTSYSPKSPIHDTNLNAAYIAYLLSRLGDAYQSYSYWTFGDVFEENGVPYTPFHGGFGLVANGQIPKPTFWTFQFFKQLQGDCVHRSENAVIVCRKDGRYCGVAWNLVISTDGTELTLSFTLPVKGEEYYLLTKTVDETVCNPLKIWHDMGEPSNLSREQLTVLLEGSTPLLNTQRLMANGETLTVTLSLKKNAVVYFQIDPVAGNSDRGYSYQRVIQQECPTQSEVCPVWDR